MSQIDIELSPHKLRTPQMNTLVYVLRNEKASKIITSLCDKKGSYFNEIHQKVSGSKTSTQEILRGLERLKIVRSEWQVKHFDKAGKKMTRAVKSFKLTEDKEKLIEHYLPLIRKMIIS